VGHYRRALGFALPYWKRLGFVLFVSMFATLLGLAQPYFLKVLIDDAFLAQNFSLLVRVSLLLFAVSIASVVLNAISGYRYRLSPSSNIVTAFLCEDPVGRHPLEIERRRV